MNQLKAECMAQQQINDLNNAGIKYKDNMFQVYVDHFLNGGDFNGAKKLNPKASRTSSKESTGLDDSKGGETTEERLPRRRGRPPKKPTTEAD